MPTSLLSADSQFPDLKKGQSTDEKFEVVTNYLYMLLEQLRYTLCNLGLNNINEDEFLTMGQLITQPISVQLEGDEGQLAQLQLTADSLSTRISDTEGNVSQLAQTAEGLGTRVTNAEGSISTLQQTASGLSSRVSTAEGNISSLTQTANGLSSRVSSAEGNISSLTQTVNGFSLSVSNGETSSTISLLSNGVAISSKVVKFTGAVTFGDLETPGSTTIYGGNIDTDSLIVDTLYGDTVYLKSGDYLVGSLSLKYSSTYAVDLSSSMSLRLMAASGGNAYLGNNGAYVMCTYNSTYGDDIVTIGGGMKGTNEMAGWSLPTSNLQPYRVFFLLED